MPALVYTAIIQEPVVVSQLRSSTIIQETERYIPGGTILGVCAARYIDQHGLGQDAHRDPTFRRLFLTGDTRFLNAYLSVETGAGGARRLLPVPNLIMAHKRDPSRAWNALGPSPEDDGRHVPGFCSIAADIVHYAVPRTTISYHTTRDRLHGRAMESRGPWSYEAIAAGQQFQGMVVGGDEELETIRGLLESGPLVRIGRSKGAQYGETMITVQPGTWPAHELPADERADPANEDELVVTLCSHMIPGPGAERLHSGVSIPRDLARAVAGASNVDSWRDARGFLSTTFAGGYSSRWGMPREQAHALAMGSVLVFPNIDRDRLPGDFDERSYGMRTAEGFGRVVIDWPPDAIRAAMRHDEQRAQPKPEFDPPESFSKIVLSRARALQDKEAVRYALELVSDAQGVPPNAFLGRIDALFRSNPVDDALAEIEGILGDQTQRGKPVFRSLSRFRMGHSLLPEVVREFREHAYPGGFQRFARESGVELPAFSDEAVRLFVQTLLRELRHKRQAQHRAAREGSAHG